MSASTRTDAAAGIVTNAPQNARNRLRVPSTAACRRSRGPPPRRARPRPGWRRSGSTPLARPARVRHLHHVERIGVVAHEVPAGRLDVVGQAEAPHQVASRRPPARRRARVPPRAAARRRTSRSRPPGRCRRRPPRPGTGARPPARRRQPGRVAGSRRVTSSRMSGRARRAPRSSAGELSRTRPRPAWGFAIDGERAERTGHAVRIVCYRRRCRRRRRGGRPCAGSADELGDLGRRHVLDLAQEVERAACSCGRSPPAPSRSPASTSSSGLPSAQWKIGVAKPGSSSRQSCTWCSSSVRRTGRHDPGELLVALRGHRAWASRRAAARARAPRRRPRRAALRPRRAESPSNEACGQRLADQEVALAVDPRERPALVRDRPAVARTRAPRARRAHGRTGVRGSRSGPGSAGPRPELRLERVGPHRPAFVLGALGAGVARMVDAPRASSRAASRSTFGSARAARGFVAASRAGRRAWRPRRGGTGRFASSPTAGSAIRVSTAGGSSKSLAESRKNERSCESTVGFPSREDDHDRETRGASPPGTWITSPGRRVATASRTASARSCSRPRRSSSRSCCAFARSAPVLVEVPEMADHVLRGSPRAPPDPAAALALERHHPAVGQELRER